LRFQKLEQKENNLLEEMRYVMTLKRIDKKRP